jgi:hypothetical protein
VRRSSSRTKSRLHKCRYFWGQFLSAMRVNPIEIQPRLCRNGAKRNFERNENDGSAIVCAHYKKIRWYLSDFTFQCQTDTHQLSVHLFSRTFQNQRDAMHNFQSPSAIILGLLATAAKSKVQATHTIPVPSTVPTSASHPIDPSFPGFAFEQASFYNYSFDVNGNPNTFSQNLINSVLNRTGGTPLIRVGGTSGDRGRFNAQQQSPTNCSATERGPCFGGSGHPSLSLGPTYFEAFKNFPGAQYEFMVPLHGRDLNNTLEWTKAGLDAIGNNLYALEIGNEPNYYPWFAKDAYVNEYRRFEAALQRKFMSLQRNRIFQALDIASQQENTLSTHKAFELGLKNDTTSIYQVAYHYYQNSTPTTFADLQSWLLHSNTVKGLSVFESDIAYLRKYHPHIGFVLSEVGDSLGGKSGGPRWQNNLATALWAMDFQLQAMSIGVDRVNLQSILSPGFCLWEPVNSTWGPPTVRANYYSHPFVAEFIGSTHQSQVIPLNVSDADGKLAAYAAYDSCKLARIVVVNLDLWRPGNGTRGNATLTLQNLPDDLEAATAHHLSAANGTFAETGLTWKGLEWTYESNGIERQVKNDSSQVAVKGGKIDISINATSAVMLVF